jgi:hypothetical protein
MWRFIEGVQNPNKKMKVDADKHQRDSEYDRRRVRTFQNSWKTCTPVSSTIKTDCHDIIGILLKVAFYTITLTINHP